MLPISLIVNGQTERLDDEFEVIIVGADDTHAHPLGIGGMGEVGVAGTGAAVGNAIFHATGVRLTALPFRIDRLPGAVPPATAPPRRTQARG